ncbi:hypothetical protein BT96DRAFT_1005955 [Gymnopus androsaceus JB14]|uniref:Uncharacterized protein n=1 Tax=Gymnopus androsaceus JB14 TaxID=1447944 RepID=A0A6A4GMQ5_9AGAR|nr:hypothetical protein BT96DRAFT_1005955 [Gymnopus androsaceus JB14]
MSTAGEYYSEWRNNSHEPPSIPPLSFGKEDCESFSDARSFMRSGAVECLNAYNARSAQQARHATTALPSQMCSSECPDHLPTFSRYRARESACRGEDIHGAITRQVRMEESLIEGSVPSTGSISTTTLGDESLNYAIDVLRQDGLSDTHSHQLMNRYAKKRFTPDIIINQYIMG